MTNIFVLGCSRGGTTVVQSVLAQSPDLVSFPESNLLYNLLRDHDYRRFGSYMGRRDLPYFMLVGLVHRLGFSLEEPAPHFQKFLAEVQREDLSHLIPQGRRSLDSICRAFENILTEMAGGKRWVEKTPQHVFCIDVMHKFFPTAHFVHVIRRPEDNIASLVDAGRKYEVFRGRFGGEDGVRKAVTYWNRSLSRSASMKGNERHSFVRYEDVVISPADALSGVAKKTGIDISDGMESYNLEGIAYKNETWKRNSDRIEPQPTKFYDVFSEEERTYVRENALRVDEIFPQQLSGYVPLKGTAAGPA